MLEERPKIEAALQTVFRRENFAVRRMPEEHADGKWSLRYTSASGHSGKLDADFNFMYRVPLWPVTIMDSHPLGSWRVTDIPVVDLHELAAGKLSALLSRCKARDLFDSYLIFSMDGLDLERLRIAFVVYGAMDRKDWRKVVITDAAFDNMELVNQLVPMLHANAIQGPVEAAAYGETLINECRQGLAAVLPFTDAERAFLDLLLEQGKSTRRS